MEGESLVQREAQEQQIDPLSIQMAAGEGPLYFALVDEENGVAERESVQEAKDIVSGLYEEFPEEIAALAGADKATAKAKIEELRTMKMAA